MDIDDPDGSQPVTMGITDFWAVINTLNPSASAPPRPPICPLPLRPNSTPPRRIPSRGRISTQDRRRAKGRRRKGLRMQVGFQRQWVWRRRLRQSPLRRGPRQGSAGRGAGSSKAGAAASAGSSSANVQAKNPSPWDLRDPEAVIVVLGFVDEHIGIMNTVLNKLLIAHEKLVRTRILSLSALEKLNHVVYAHHAELDIKQKGDKSWISINRRIDQARLLKSFLNKEMPPLPQVLAQIAEKQETTPSEATEWPQIYRPDSFLCVFDFVGAANFHRSYSLNVYTADVWSSSASGLWRPRLHQYVLDMEANRDEIVLVEGLFRFNTEKIIFTLLKMRYNPNGPEVFVGTLCLRVAIY
ncbi:hypothetical protein DFP72DRAFT_847736 [Ephemerocybe angulata]|uniref:Uncharacterized protein n=1 Tax=Ephemerocybe angulata TaxID=980116 RepID=A0A8H6HXY4_9AGAR|nr:hypothetical protein DFP72DRAFT_847736 [Tulosesus angulatus]